MEEEGRNEEHRERSRGGIRIRPNYFMQKPVKVGDVVDVKIEAVASKGDGIAKIEGFVIFVPGGKEGQEVKVKITEVKPRFATGEIQS
ncbi:MAG: TRAM domain-containing protein [Candidatus Micrarchaeaceae archaeon]